MSDAIPYPLEPGDRGLPFIDYITDIGVDYTGWTFAMQVRLYPDAPGSPIIDLNSVSDGSEGILIEYAGSATISAHVAATRIPVGIYDEINSTTGAKYDPADVVPMTILRIYIDSPAMSSPNIPLPPDIGEDWVGSWDMIGDDGAGPNVPQKLYFGMFPVRGTVTR